MSEFIAWGTGGDWNEALQWAAIMFILGTRPMYFQIKDWIRASSGEEK